MALIVGTDSYISAADAELYLASNYTSTDPKLVKWTATSAADKDVLLRQACRIIDRQKFQGTKATTTQALQFPREIYTAYDSAKIVGVTPFLGDNIFRQTEPPKSVLYAQCEIAFKLAQGTDKRHELQAAGVTSFSVGGLSESYKGAFKDVPSQEARDLLLPFTGGGFSMC